ncbi:uncharacterized protein I303_100243 [Kwoniella dejecticola CBS 10117]|uniref:Uncharacterized protein n=1 Tax=Kwoniella dejecticola CBS 10117 TaxID=1296121 RepID=A0A1A6AEH7_9TREE|nr:uncharacterized protein I303_00245 [Kwoniella dejecticola CBS 10117]OBR88428.1 hypothetical protein I303_00245 [Kwoniella dejecticola CBS 10117]
MRAILLGLCGLLSAVHAVSALKSSNSEYPEASGPAHSIHARDDGSGIITFFLDQWTGVGADTWGNAEDGWEYKKNSEPGVKRIAIGDPNKHEPFEDAYTLYAYDEPPADMKEDDAWFEETADRKRKVRFKISNPSGDLERVAEIHVHRNDEELFVNKDGAGVTLEKTDVRPGREF